MTIDGENTPADAAGSDARTHFPHAAVWLDHFHAVIVFLAPDVHRTVKLESEREDTRLHRKSGAPGSGRLPLDTQFFDRVAEELAAHAADVLVAGPGSAKIDFRRSVEKRQPSLATRIVDVVTLDHPSDGELTEFARRQFRRIDQLGLSKS
jgi:stalled ribosome rescue protein Dom34